MRELEGNRCPGKGVGTSANPRDAAQLVEFGGRAGRRISVIADGHDVEDSAANGVACRDGTGRHGTASGLCAVDGGPLLKSSGLISKSRQRVQWVAGNENRLPSMATTPASSKPCKWRREGGAGTSGKRSCRRRELAYLWNYPIHLNCGCFPEQYTICCHGNVRLNRSDRSGAARIAPVGVMHSRSAGHGRPSLLR